MIHGRTRQRGAWLGLLAMLLVFVGPLLSQAREMGGATVPAWVGELACASGHDAGSHEPGPSSHHELSWAKCGYCTLLFNSPALNPSSSPGFLPADAGAVRPGETPLAGFASHSVFPGALTRAPPVVPA
ncbi:DUF2946 domain-containing protein [Metapseudomonas furukawaii]|uniref:DUF2946 domain-containing protein n=1 Tax=Metapseudomonas furukawaii TaxID=1149133 RepID=UPI0040459F9B